MLIDLVHLGAVDDIAQKQIKESFPFVEHIYEFNSSYPWHSMEFFADLLAKNPGLANNFILITSLNQKSYLLNDFIDSKDNAKIVIKKLLPKSEWDMSKSHWVTQKFRLKSEEYFFNSRNFIYKKYGVNCRFCLLANTPYLYNKESIQNIIDLLKQSNQCLETYDSTIIFYFESLC